MIHLGGQHCVVCGDPIAPTDRYHSLPSTGRLGVDFAHADCCPLCKEEEEGQ